MSLGGGFFGSGYYNRPSPYLSSTIILFDTHLWKYYEQTVKKVLLCTIYGLKWFVQQIYTVKNEVCYTRVKVCIPYF